VKRVLAVIAVLLSACTRLAPLSQNQIAAAGEKWPGTTDLMLHEGQRLYSVRCSSCHSLYQPDALEAHDWNSIAEEMVERAKLSTHEQDLVFRYLWAASVAPLEEEAGAAQVSAQK
jgi:hypothetical protein